MSNKNLGKNPRHRKPKVSWATQIDPGLVGPKVRPKGVADGQLVNIPALPYMFLKIDASLILKRILVICVVVLIFCQSDKRGSRQAEPILVNMVPRKDFKLSIR